jgi:hypothetical protein
MDHAKLRFPVRAAALVIVIATVSPAQAGAVDLQGVVVSADAATTVDGQTVRDSDLLAMKPDGGGLTVLAEIANQLPDGVDVDAVSILDDDTVVFSTSVSFSTGDVEADDEDLVSYGGGVLALLFDGGADGLPGASDIDAVHVASLTPLDFYYSLDAPAEVHGSVMTDDDIVRFYRGVHSVALTGAALLGDEATRADVDALWVDLEATEFVVSVDVSIARSTGRTAAADEDLVRWVGGSLRRFVVGANVGLDAPGLDVDAAHIQTNLFADGFESGDTTRWSSTIP